MKCMEYGLGMELTGSFECGSGGEDRFSVVGGCGFVAAVVGGWGCLCSSVGSEGWRGDHFSMISLMMS